jgi:hypothetical protein
VSRDRLSTAQERPQVDMSTAITGVVWVRVEAEEHFRVVVVDGAERPELAVQGLWGARQVGDLHIVGVPVSCGREVDLVLADTAVRDVMAPTAQLERDEVLEDPVVVARSIEERVEEADVAEGELLAVVGARVHLGDAIGHSRTIKSLE